MKSKVDRKNVKRVDSLLHKNASLNASLGNDSTKAEMESVKKQIRHNIKKIKDLCSYIYSIINMDDNHKTTN